MAVIGKVKWNEGDGYIIATSEGRGDVPVTLTTDGPNEGIDREQVVIFETVKGLNVDNKKVLVKQKGMREPYLVDGEEYLLTDGMSYNVLKN